MRISAASVADWHDLEGLTKSLARSSGKLMVLGCLALMGLMCVPLPYNVRGSCEIHPVKLQFVAAPFEADCSRRKSNLARGSRDNCWPSLMARRSAGSCRSHCRVRPARQRTRRASGREGHQRCSGLSPGDGPAGCQGHRPPPTQREQLEIRSPSAEWSSAATCARPKGPPSRPVRLLFEIAPLEEMVMEIGIPEEDISHVQVGQTVQATLNALADRTWTGTIERIHPRSELVEQDYVFVAEVKFSNEHGLLRPGMKGRVQSHHCPADAGLEPVPQGVGPGPPLAGVVNGSQYSVLSRSPDN